MFSIEQEDGQFEVFNCEYDYAILRNNENPIGYITPVEPVNADFVKYRKYTVVIDDGRKFIDTLAKNNKWAINRLL